jgi:hypothetical protein
MECPSVQSYQNGGWEVVSALSAGFTALRGECLHNQYYTARPMKVRVQVGIL